ncbi:MAG: hypothetical protein HC877_01490 [Thioploca sp.]|nr:hypothetical protein [Thioploca sp.]
MIDNTQQKTSTNDQVLRQQVEKQQQQRVDYQKAQAKKSQAQTQQTYLADLLKQWAEQEKQWIKTQKITPLMTRLLAELVEVKEVVISMTEEQVKQAWGKPSSESVALIDNQQVKTWGYPNGKQVILQAGRVQAIKR